MKETKKVAISQSSFIPWKGYFDMVARADIFVLYDIVQFTKRDWRNRNKIKTPDGAQWLTVPVITKGRSFQKIHEAEVSNAAWVDKHIRSFEINYRKAAFFHPTMEWLSPLYSQFKDMRQLSRINKLLIQKVCEELLIPTTIMDANCFLIEGNKNEALLSILHQIGGVTHYISGLTAKAYLDEDLFARHHIQVEWMDYTGYPEYHQLYPPFVHEVSILDLLFNEGHRSPEFLKDAHKPSSRA